MLSAALEGRQPRLVLREPEFLAESLKL
jgi:hypothetical protein